jgi:hypothetical protein
MSFLDGIFFVKMWLNGIRVSETPRDLEIVGDGVTHSIVEGRSVYDLSSFSTGGGGGGDVPATRLINAGNGLTGGGSLAADRTLNVTAHADGSIAVSADAVQVGVLATDTQHGSRGGGTQHAAATTSVAGFMAAADKTKLDALPATAPPTTRLVTAGAGMTGGGDLAADRTLNVTAHVDGSIAVSADAVQVGVLASDAQHGTRGGGTQHSAATTSIAGFMSAADKVKLDGLSASGVATSRALTAGAGMTGGGDLTADRTFNLVAADGTIQVNADSVQVGVLTGANYANNTIAPARLTNASAQHNMMARKTAGAGPWEDCTPAEARTCLGIVPGATGTLPYSNGTSLGNASAFTTDGTSLLGLSSVRSTGTVPNTGFWRVANGLGAFWIGVGALAGTPLHGLSYGADNVCRLGDVNAPEVDIVAAGAVDINNGTAGALNWRFGTTRIDAFNKGIATLEYLAQDGTPATSGFVRTINNPGDIVTHAGHGGNNMRVLGCGSNGSTFSDVYLGYNGHAEGNASAYIYAKSQIINDLLSGGVYHIYVAGNPEWSYTASALDAHGNNLTNIGTASFGGVTGATIVADTGTLFIGENTLANVVNAAIDSYTWKLDISGLPGTTAMTLIDAGSGVAELRLHGSGKFRGATCDLTGSLTSAAATITTLTATTINGSALLAPVEGSAISDADTTITISGGALRRIGTLTAPRTIDIDNTGAVDKEVIVLYRSGTEAFAATIRDHSNATIATFPASTKIAGSFRKSPGGNFEHLGFQRIN